MEVNAESCESAIYSMYIDVKGDFYPCSFSTEVENWKDNGLSVLKCNDFIKDIWFNEKTRKFSEGVIKCRNCKQSCSIFEI